MIMVSFSLKFQVHHWLMMFAARENNHFPFDQIWMFSLDLVETYDSDPANYVDITFESTEGPIRFQRDLLFADPPEPASDINPTHDN